MQPVFLPWVLVGTALSQLFRKFRYCIPHGSVQSRSSYSSIMGIFLEQITWNIPTLYLLGFLFYKSHYWILDRLKWSFNSFFFFFSPYNFLSLCLFCSILWEIYSTFPLALLVNVFFLLTCIWFFFIPGIFLSSCHLFLFQEYSIFSSLFRDFFFAHFYYFLHFVFFLFPFFPIYLIILSLFLSLSYVWAVVLDRERFCP